MSNPKTPISELKEYCEKNSTVGTPEYTEEMKNSLFQCEVKVGIFKQIGQGKNKKEAKHDAAKKMMEHFHESKCVSQPANGQPFVSVSPYNGGFDSSPPSYEQATAQRPPIQPPPPTQSPSSTPTAPSATVMSRQQPFEPAKSNDVLAAKFNAVVGETEIELSLKIRHKPNVSENSDKCEITCRGTPVNDAFNGAVHDGGYTANTPFPQSMRLESIEALISDLSSTTPSPKTPGPATLQPFSLPTLSQRENLQLKHLHSLSLGTQSDSSTNYVGCLNEMSQRGVILAPSYSEIESAENGQFSCTTSLPDGNENLSQTGFGPTKKMAKQNAAESMINELRKRKQGLFSSDDSSQ